MLLIQAGHLAHERWGVALEADEEPEDIGASCIDEIVSVNPGLSNEKVINTKIITINKRSL